MSESNPTPPSELKTLIRKNFLLALLSLIALGALAAFLMIELRPQLDLVTQAIFATVGLGGLTLLLFLTDAFVSPFPPDSILILIAASEYHENWLVLIPSLGVVSAIAGGVGYGGGRYFADKSWAESWFGSFRAKSEDTIHRFGAMGVAIGALTPLPFSITCWGAGLLRVPFRKVWPSFLLRIPRYVVYYAVIAFFPKLFG